MNKSSVLTVAALHFDRVKIELKPREPPFVFTTHNSELSMQCDRVSVVIPALNESKTIAGAVEALRPAGLIDEVIVVVDCKTVDDTAAVALKAGATVIVSQRAGLGNVFAEGIRAARNRWIFRTDGDIPAPDRSWISRMAPLINQDVRLVKSYWDYRQKPRLTSLLVVEPSFKRLFPELAYVRQPISGIYLFDKDILDLGVFSGGMGIDVELVLLIHQMGYSIDQIAIDPIFDRQKTPFEIAPIAHDVLTSILRFAKTFKPVPNLLLVMAHADDAEIWCGGTVLKHALLGARVDLAILRVDSIRKIEAKATEIQIPNLHLHFLTDECAGSDRSDYANFLASLLVKYRHGVVITHHPHDLHPDHRDCSEIVNRLLFSRSEFTSFPSVYWCNGYCGSTALQTFEPDTFVDISSEATAKDALIRNHESQRTEFYLNMVERMDRFYGFRCGAGRAEAFKRASWYKTTRPTHVLS